MQCDTKNTYNSGLERVEARTVGLALPPCGVCNMDNIKGACLVLTTIFMSSGCHGPFSCRGARSKLGPYSSTSETSYLATLIFKCRQPK